MKQLLIALSVSAATIVTSSVAVQAAPRGPATFYDQQGQFRGYAWCRKPGMDIVDCNYYTLAQCQASGRGLGPAVCVPNPFASYGQTQPRRRRVY